ncbi:MAG TPA: hypothetical protein DDX92_04145 [Flavobacteriales bacterium]|jgi:hypothetical protein|nr:hypothetical protein [Flavobacteriales bacterium]
MKKYRIPIVVLAVLAAFSLQTCKHCNDPTNPDCANYDPCWDQTQADASFTIYEVLQEMPIQRLNGFTGEDAATDTIINWNTARFKADFEAEYYEWRVGDDPRVWNTREFTLKFRSIPTYFPVEVSLKVYKPTNRSCFPNSNDTAEFRRSIVTVPQDSSLMINRFEGYLESDPNRLNFFELEPEQHSSGRESFRLKGIFPKCSLNLEEGPSTYAFGYRSVFISTRGIGVGCCFHLSGYGVLSNNNRFEMEVGMLPFNPSDSCSSSLLNDPYLNDVFTETNQ